MSAVTLLPLGALAQSTAPASPEPSSEAKAAAKADAPADAASDAKPDAASAASGLGTVYVTARKRAELQIDVPISVQTMSDKDLRASGTTSVSDLSSQAGFTFTSAQSTGAYGRSAGMVTFRGLQGELGRPNDASGGVFLDGVAITNGISTLGMSDIARVEVLKGPQNAFFGRSTFGGAVNFITKVPADEFRGTVNTNINHHGSSDVDASMEGPLIAGLLKGRLMVASHNKVAEQHASDGGELGAENSRTITGTLYVTPTEKLWLRLRGSYQENDDSLPAVAYLAATNNTSCTGRTYTGTGRDGATVSYTPGTAYFCGSIPDLKQLGSGVINANTTIPAAAYNAFVNNSLNDPYLAKTPRLDHMGMRSEVKQASLQAGYELPKDMELAFNLGYNEANTTSIYDLDKTGTANFFSAQINPTHDLTVDTRLSTDARQSLRGVVGASLFRSSYVYSQIDYSPGFGGTAAGISTNFSNFDSTVPAVYGSVEYDFTPQITGSLEARYQRDQIKSYSRAGAVQENRTSNVLPRLTLRYKPTTNISTYFNVAKGVQPLTVNSGFSSASAAAKAYILTQVPTASDFTEQPTLTSFELGFKQRVGNNFQYALALYDMQWKHRLTSTTIFNPASCGTTSGTAECPLTASGTGIQSGNDARIRGIELSVDAQLTPSWVVGAYVDYKRARWTRYDSSSQSRYGSYGTAALTGYAVSFDGNTVARVPDIQVNANTTYRFNPLSNGWRPWLRADVLYVGRMWESDFNFARTDPYSRIDLRLGFDKNDMSFDIYVRNLANDRSWTTVSRVNNLGLSPLTSFSQQGLTAMAQEERAFGVRASYSF
ncbi:TonB-dependent receptor [Roseateles sp. SL47]|uniref:TonB-dependent receptor n=1 Tax=Roseateles sp. SL47 TaxID=2995138 RepID=UPI0022708C87|nr:TonB-dependent receptor [Roseateles sp. SL47]WAC71972.1 TonB-dependent receptor [Roseateles sp. SL47]